MDRTDASRLLGLALLGLAACPDQDPPVPGTAVRAEPSPPPPAAAPALPSAEQIARATAPAAAREPVAIDWSGGDRARGQALYAQQCTICHGASGKGDGPGAAALNPKPRDFTSGAFYLDGDADAVTGEPVDLARVIQKGAAAFGGSPAMQAWEGTLSDAQIRDLVAYIASLAAQRSGG